MHSQLASLDEQFETISREIRADFGTVSGDRFRERPSPDRWSAAECVVHLTLSTHGMLPKIQAAIPGAPPLAPNRLLKVSLLGGWLARNLEPPPRRPYSTTPEFVPSPGDTAGDVLAAFEESQRDLRRRLHDADGRDVSRVKVTSPFLRLLRYNVYTAFVILAAHQRRHVWQGHRALEELRRQA